MSRDENNTEEKQGCKRASHCTMRNALECGAYNLSIYSVCWIWIFFNFILPHGIHESRDQRHRLIWRILWIKGRGYIASTLFFIIYSLSFNLF